MKFKHGSLAGVVLFFDRSPQGESARSAPASMPLRDCIAA